MTSPQPGTPEWLGQVTEDILDPDQPIVDPHHHLWPEGEGIPYQLGDLDADTTTGHNVERTVFVQCHASHRPDGPEHLKPVGETEFVAANARASVDGPGATIAGIVGHADLTLDAATLDEVLDAHEAAGDGRFRGIRHIGASDPDPGALRIPGSADPDLYATDEFRAGVAQLGARGLTFDAWHYHHQNPAFAELAAAVPDTTMILDHFGTPIGVGRFAGKLDEVFAEWKDSIAAVAENPNVVAKLGGAAMPDNGYGWHEAERPPTSDEFVDAQERWYLHTIECFGPDRCMFESNFPVDRFSISYAVLWNGFKKIAARFTPAERDAMFQGTASRVYRI